LEGAEQALRRTRPRILIEVQKSHVAAVDEFCESLGFQHTNIRDFIGCRGAAGNYFYMPQESH
jgi:hypothetical protein